MQKMCWVLQDGSNRICACHQGFHKQTDTSQQLITTSENQHCQLLRSSASCRQMLLHHRSAVTCGKPLTRCSTDTRCHLKVLGFQRAPQFSALPTLVTLTSCFLHLPPLSCVYLFDSPKYSCATHPPGTGGFQRQSACLCHHKVAAPVKFRLAEGTAASQPLFASCVTHSMPYFPSV